MQNKNVEVIIYGAEQLCSSCVHLPSSIDTFEWLQAALARKYSGQPIKISYVDIYNPPEEKAIRDFAQKMIDEDMFYPVVVINEKVVGEGNLRLKSIYAELEKYGYKEE